MLKWMAVAGNQGGGFGSGSSTGIEGSLDMEETTSVSTQALFGSDSWKKSAKSECVNYLGLWESISYLLPILFQDVQPKFLMLSSGSQRESVHSNLRKSRLICQSLPPTALGRVWSVVIL